MARILITGFCSVPSPSRVGVQLGHVIRGLHRQHQVDVLTVRQDDQGHVERHGDTRYLRVPLPEGDLASNVEVFRRALRRQVEGADYDVVHFRDGWSGVTALELQARHGFATVFDLARSPMAEPILGDRATATELDRAEQSCVRKADLVLAPTEPARRFLAGVTDEEKIHVVPPGVDVDRFDWEDIRVDRSPVILYMGTLAAGRGVRVLLRAMHDVAAASNAVLMLAGPASKSFSDSLAKAVIDLQIEERVQFLGEVPHELVPLVIARAAICVAPGAVELASKPTALFPTKILEYMACRRAVVAPDRGTVNMLFRDGEQGMYFKPGDPADLAETLLCLLRDRKLRAQVASGGYEMVRTNCTASGTRRSLRRAYRWLASQEEFRERLGRPVASDVRLAPITGLAIDLRGGRFSSEKHQRASDGSVLSSVCEAKHSRTPEVNSFDTRVLEPRIARSGYHSTASDQLEGEERAETVAAAAPLAHAAAEGPAGVATESLAGEDSWNATLVELAVLPPEDVSTVVEVATQGLTPVSQGPASHEIDGPQANALPHSAVGEGEGDLAIKTGQEHESWEALLEVLESEDLDTGAREIEASTPKTVITVPMDNSLVAGELAQKTPRPDLERCSPPGALSPTTPKSSIMVSRSQDDLAGPTDDSGMKTMPVRVLPLPPKETE